MAFKLAEAHLYFIQMHKESPFAARGLLDIPSAYEPLSDWPLKATALALVGAGGSFDDIETTEGLWEALRRAQRMAIDKQANWADWWEACEIVRDAVCDAAEQALTEEQGEPWELNDLGLEGNTRE